MAAPGDFDVRVFEVEDLRIKKLRRENKLEKKRTKKVEFFWVFFRNGSVVNECNLSPGMDFATKSQ